MNVGIVGATGLVGGIMRTLLAERGFPVSTLRAFASSRSAGRTIPWAGGEVKVEDVATADFRGLDLALFAAGATLSKELAPKVAAAGAVVVDNSSGWRHDPDVPLVVAEVNPHALDSIPKGIVANPNCTTMVTMPVLGPLHREGGLRRVVASTYQSVSGTGREAIKELKKQSEAILKGKEAEAKVFPHQVAFNVLPQVEQFTEGDDYTTEERKVMRETRKILGLSEDVGISATCVRVPVVTGHSESVNVQTERDLSPENCRELLSETPGVVVLDDPGAGVYPLPIAVEGRDEVLVGRIRRDPSHERALNLWIVGDNLRKGAATNAVQVAEALVARGRLPGAAQSRPGTQ